MKNELKIKAKQEAKDEGKFSAGSLANELVALVKEYYIATVRVAGNNIVIRFPNGQQAILTVNT